MSNRIIVPGATDLEIVVFATRHRSHIMRPMKLSPNVQCVKVRALSLAHLALYRGFVAANVGQNLA